MINGKKVAVVMPAYNAEKTLRKTWEETVRQPFVDLVIVVDDASRDEARHARYIQIMDIPEYLRADPMIIKFLSDFLMKNNPPVREKTVKIMEDIPVRIVLSGPPGTGFIRAEPAEEEPVRQQE